MQKILIGVASMVLLISLAVVGSILWLNHKKSEPQAQLGPMLDLKNFGPKLDFHDPATAASFGKNYADNCVATFQNNASEAGGAPSEDQLDQVRSACECIANHMIADLAARSPISAFELATTLGSDREVPGVKECGAKLP